MSLESRRLSPWLQVTGPGEPERVLLALPYAGGSGRAFRPWVSSLPVGWALATVELPGHGRRLNETCLATADEVVDAILCELHVLPTAPLSILGYSLGGLLAFELAFALTATGTPPASLVVCACRAPHTGAGHPPVALLPPGPEFLQRAVEYGLAAPEMLTVPALGEQFGGALHCDLAMAEAYRARHRLREPLRVPVCVVGALDDHLCPPPSMLAWAALTYRPPLHLWVSGSHMAIEEDPDQVGRTVWEGLSLMANEQSSANEMRGARR